MISAAKRRLPAIGQGGRVLGVGCWVTARSRHDFADVCGREYP